MDKKTVGSSALLGLAALIWGVAFVAQSLGMEYVGAFTFNACRFLIGGGVLVPVIWFMGGEKRKSGKENVSGTGGEPGESRETGRRQRQKKQKTAIAGGVCCGAALFVASSFQQFGVAHTTVGKAGFITALYIVIVPLLGIFLKKKVLWSVWVSVALATAGMYLLCMSEGLKVNKGDIYVFICAVCFSFHILIIDYFSPKADGADY